MKMKRKSQSSLLTTEEARSSRGWFILDAKGKTLGRFASEVAKILRGKHRVDFTPHIDCGDGVIVLNAAHVCVSGKKEARKTYRYYTGSMGGLREIPYRMMKEKKPTFIIEHAVKKMMPKTKLARAQVARLRVFVDDQHDLQAQKAVFVET